MKRDIKVNVNYPTTPEGKNKLEHSKADAVYEILTQILTPEQLDKLVERL